MKNTNSKFPAKTKMGAFFHTNEPLSNEKVTHIDHIDHTVGKSRNTIRKNRYPIFLICCANNVDVVEHNGKRIEILNDAGVLLRAIPHFLTERASNLS